MITEQKQNLEKTLLNKIDKTKLPVHIAIIIDGNGRWAKKRNLPRIYGHREGIKTVRKIVEVCSDLGIKILTLYAFSTENWKRPQKEVQGLMRLLNFYLDKEGNKLHKNNIKFIVIGDISKLSENIQQKIKHIIELTKNNTKMILNIALNYGGRQEIIHCVNEILKTNYKNIDEEIFSKFIFTKNLPDPDLLIRTSGELRISNFLLWQIAYTELYFTPILWPDFDKIELYKAIIEYQNRKRRFGGI